jgi:hypothetical protein
MEFGYANNKKYNSLLPNADNVAKKTTCPRCWFAKNCENVNGSTPCTVSAACFKTTGTINKKNYNKMHFLKRLHKCLKVHKNEIFFGSDFEICTFS